MKQPKKIYFSHSIDGTMKTTLAGKRFNNTDAEYISVDHLKEWAKKEDEKLQFQGVVRIDELLHFIES